MKITKKLNFMLKMGVMSLATLSLIASGNEGGNPANLTGGTGSTDLGLGLSPDDTISQNTFQVTIVNSGLLHVFKFFLDMNSIALANSQYYTKATGKWERIKGHTINLGASAEIEGEFNEADESAVITKLLLGTGSSNFVRFLLTSATETIEFKTPSKTLSKEEIDRINALIATVLKQAPTTTTATATTTKEYLDLISPLLTENGVVLPTGFTDLVKTAITDVQKGNVKVGGMVLPLNYKGTAPNSIADVQTTGGEITTSGLYGGYGLDIEGNKQFTSFYAKEAGSTLIGSEAGTDAKHNVSFAGASFIADEVKSLHGSGTVVVDFGKGSLKTEDGIDIHSISNGAHGSLNFDLKYDPKHKLFTSDTAKFVSSGKTEIIGNAEAGVFEKDSKQSILGSVDLRTGNNVLVGGFGSTPIIKDLDGKDIPDGFQLPAVSK